MPTLALTSPWPYMRSQNQAQQQRSAMEPMMAALTGRSAITTGYHFPRIEDRSMLRTDDPGTILGAMRSTRARN
jgi:hypothetical protein